MVGGMVLAAILAIVLVGGSALLAYAYFHFSLKALLKFWADEAGIRLLKWRFYLFSSSPKSTIWWKLKLRRYTAVRVTIEDSHGRTRKAWLGVRPTWINPVGSVAEVVWDE